MKKIIITMVTLFTTLANINAMTYSQARSEALFLTDKMAYELNLNEEQYEAAYEINLDYLMSVNTVDDVYSNYWRQRNLDLQYILYDWQYSAYCAASYFYRPIFWNAGYWHFGIYAYYPHRTHYFFSRPACYNVYRGGHSWRINGGRSWYANRVSHFRHANYRSHHIGMRDNYKGGTNHNYHRGNNTVRRGNNYNRNYNTTRQSVGTNRGNTAERHSYENRRSSTRTTVGNNAANTPRTRNNATTRSNNYSNSSRSSHFSGNGTSRGSSFSGSHSSHSSGSFGGTRSSGSSSRGNSSATHGGGRR